MLQFFQLFCGQVEEVGDVATSHIFIPKEISFGRSHPLCKLLVVLPQIVPVCIAVGLIPVGVREPSSTIGCPAAIKGGGCLLRLPQVGLGLSLNIRYLGAVSLFHQLLLILEVIFPSIKKPAPFLDGCIEVLSTTTEDARKVSSEYTGYTLNHASNDIADTFKNTCNDSGEVFKNLLDDICNLVE